MNLSVEHVLMFALFVCALYYLTCKCGKEGLGDEQPPVHINMCDSPAVPPHRRFDCKTSYDYCINNNGNPVYSAADNTYSCSWSGPNNFNKCSEVNDCAQPTEKEFPDKFRKYMDRLKRGEDPTDCKSSSAEENDWCELTSSIDGETKRIGVCLDGTCYERGDNCQKPIGKLCPDNSTPMCIDQNYISQDSAISCGHY
jgi:hypothetical protein